jgi:hypothetical protein
MVTATEEDSLEPEPILEQAMVDVVAALGATGAAVYLRDPDQPVLRLAAARGDAAGAVPREVSWGKGLIGSAAEQADVLEAADDGPFTAAAPLLLGDEAVGSLGVARAARLTLAEADGLLARSRKVARALAPPPLDSLRAELGRRVPPAGLTWLDTMLAAAGRGDRDAIVTMFPGVGRRVGRERLGSGTALVLRDLDVEVPLRAWRTDDAARAAMLCAFTGDAEGLARELYYNGDMREREGALRALAVVGRGRAAHDAVVDACRVAAAELVEAAIAENPYASRVLPIEEFRQVVLKCAFIGVSLERIALLEIRADAELSRMLLSYVTEREVAGRSVPPDVWPIVALHPTPGLVGKLCGYLEHPAEAHRLGAAVGLGRIGDRRARPFVEDRLAREADRTVRRALQRALA